MSNLFRCGFCDFFFGLFRRAVCPRNSRGNSNNCYRELGGQNTVVPLLLPYPTDEAELGLKIAHHDQLNSNDSVGPGKGKLRITGKSYTDSEENSTHTTLLGRRRYPAFRSGEDDSSNAIMSSLPDDLDLSTPGARRYGKKLAKIYSKKMNIPTSKKPLRNFGSLKRKARSSKASPAIVDDLYPMQAILMLARCDIWEFDSFKFDEVTGGHCIPVLGMHLLKTYDLIRYFNLEPANCLRLFHLIEMNYNATNPYHNSVHAADVAQAVHCFIQQPPLLQNLRKIEILAVLLAAFTHDLDHPGVNQSYLLATDHPIALIYNALGKDQNKKNRFLKMLWYFKPHSSSDEPTTSKKKSLCRKKKQDVESILECHHWRVAFGCIGESKVFEHMKAQLRLIKKMLKELIMATDITRQNSYLEQFRNFIYHENGDLKKAENRLIAMQMAIKTADVSNPGRPWPISYKWSEKVCQEFFMQGDKEQALKIPVTNIYDRSNNTVPSIQIAFYEQLIYPLYTEWDRYLETDLSMKLMKNVQHNATKWKRQAEPPKTKEIRRVDVRHHSVPTNQALSTGRLLQEDGRRYSYSPTRASKVKDALRRLSGPLHAIVAAPRIISEALQRGETSARKTPRRSIEEIPCSRLEPVITVEADRPLSATRRRSRSKSRVTRDVSRASDSSSSCSQERPPSRPPSRRPAAGTSTLGVRNGFAVRDWDSDTASTSTAYPQLTTVTGSSLSPSIDSNRMYPAIVMDANACAGSCDVLPRQVGPEVMRRRGSAPVVVATPATRRQHPDNLTIHVPTQKLSASCTLMAEAMAMPPVRRGSLPVMKGISAL